jgi:hypothetical protein
LIRLQHSGVGSLSVLPLATTSEATSANLVDLSILGHPHVGITRLNTIIVIEFLIQVAIGTMDIQPIRGRIPAELIFVVRRVPIALITISGIPAARSGEGRRQTRPAIANALGFTFRYRSRRVDRPLARTGRRGLSHSPLLRSLPGPVGFSLTIRPDSNSGDEPAGENANSFQAIGVVIVGTRVPIRLALDFAGLEILADVNDFISIIREGTPAGVPTNCGEHPGSTDTKRTAVLNDRE